MGLIFFVLGVPSLAIAVATYLLLRGESIPPYQEPEPEGEEIAISEHWPFPTQPKP